VNPALSRNGDAPDARHAACRALVGAMLAGGRAAYQGVFRNPGVEVLTTGHGDRAVISRRPPRGTAPAG